MDLNSALESAKVQLETSGASLQRGGSEAKVIVVLKDTLHYLLKQAGILQILENLCEQRQAIRELKTMLGDLQTAPLTMKVQFERYRQVADLRIPIFLDRDLNPTATLETGRTPHRVIVCSIPKAGTYLIAELLHRLGVAPTHLHLSAAILSDYRWASIKQMREDYQQRSFDSPLSKSSLLIQQGQFAVGHIECSEDTRAILTAFKKIFIYRNLRDALVSWLRFFEDTGRTGNATEDWKDLPVGPGKMLGFMEVLGKSFFDQCHPNWLDVPGVCSVSFEALYGDQGRMQQLEAVQRLQEFLELPRNGDAGEVLDSVIGRPTKTWSGQRSSSEIYWNADVEAKFRGFGGHLINQRLGYS